MHHFIKSNFCLIFSEEKITKINSIGQSSVKGIWLQMNNTKCYHADQLMDGISNRNLPTSLSTSIDGYEILLGFHWLKGGSLSVQKSTLPWIMMFYIYAFGKVTLVWDDIILNWLLYNTSTLVVLCTFEITSTYIGLF